MSADVVVSENGNFSFNWATEFDIRDALAEIAHLTGWVAGTEHVVHGWGRPDLYLEAGLSRYAVEIKTDLRTHSACRKAVQQAAGYRRAMPELTHSFLVAATINEAAMAEYRASYPEVWVLTAPEFISFLRHDDETATSRRCRAGLRLAEARSAVQKLSRAYIGLPEIQDVPAELRFPYERLEAGQ